MIVDRVIGSNTCDLEGCCISLGPCRASRGLDKFLRKRTCCMARHSAEASLARSNWSRAVNWSSSAIRMGSNSGGLFRISFIHSVVAIGAPLLGGVGPGVRPSCSFLHAKALQACEVSLPCVTKVLNCTRVCTPDRKGETGVDFWQSRAATFGYPVSTYFGSGHYFAHSLSEF
jgi:hypothetical protein